jgi:hypothetical protein
LAIRRGGKREVGHGIDVHAFHLQDHPFDGHAKDLRLREFLEIVFEYRGRI